MKCVFHDSLTSFITKILERLSWKGQGWKTIDQKSNRSKNPVDIANYKKQRNLVVLLNRQAKSEYFNEVSNTESSRPFWETCKPHFSNKHACGDSKIMLIENDKMLLKNEEVAKEFNQYFGHITDSLDLYEFLDLRVCKGLDDIDNIFYKCRNHPSINGTKLREIFLLDLPLQKR